MYDVQEEVESRRHCLPWEGVQDVPGHGAPTLRKRVGNTQRTTFQANTKISLPNHPTASTSIKHLAISLTTTQLLNCKLPNKASCNPHSTPNYSAASMWTMHQAALTTAHLTTHLLASRQSPHAAPTITQLFKTVSSEQVSLTTKQFALKPLQSTSKEVQQTPVKCNPTTTRTALPQ